VPDMYGRLPPYNGLSRFASFQTWLHSSLSVRSTVTADLVRYDRRESSPGGGVVAKSESPGRDCDG
jgi:hypothetical protein